VSFLVNAQPEAVPPVSHSPSEPPAPTAAEPAAGTATTDDTQPRKAGWWSRRFGNGE
jgi:ribonuclease E